MGGKYTRWVFVRIVALIVAVLVAMLVVGCAAAPRYKGVAQAGNTEHTLGITVDASKNVVSIVPASAAAHAGVEIDDTLVSLTWILSEAPAELAHFPAESGASEAASETIAQASSTPIRPPAGVEYKTVPFTETGAIRTLISYGVPLRLQIKRQGRVQQLTIIPTPSTAPITTENSLPTSY